MKIKNLIFDLDDTLIKDEKEDSLYYKEALKKCGYSEDRYYDIYMAIDEYDKLITEDNMYYDKQKILDTINNILNEKYTIELIDELINAVGKYWIERVIIEEKFIKQLSENYNLYVYTNYFTKAQYERLENIGYLKYFKKVFGADVYGSKPFKKSFERVLEEIEAKPEECIMIGDDKTRDILAANNVGMKSILYDWNGKKAKKEFDVKDFVVINDFSQVFKVLENFNK